MRRYLIILIVLSAFILFFHLGKRPLLSSGEARASEIALEMMTTGNLLVPRLNEEIILTKPPLFHWCIILCYKLFGVSEFSSRVISALSGVLVIVFLFLLGKRFWGEKTGFIAGLLLITSPLFFWSARCARIDSFLLFFITISMYCLWRGYEMLPGGGRKWFLGMFLFMGLGAMAKGPIAVITPLGTAVLFLLFTKKSSYIKKLNWLWGILLFIAIISPWFISIYFLVPHNKAEWFYVNQNKMWFGGGQSGEWYKGYVYIPHLFLGLFPWSMALPLAVLYTWKEFKDRKNDKIIFLWTWFIIVFSVFFFFGKKVSRYILPLYPAAVLLIAYVISEKKNIYPAHPLLKIVNFSWMGGVYRLFSYVLTGMWVFIVLGVVTFNFYAKFLDPELTAIILRHIDKVSIISIGLLIIAMGMYGVKRKSLASSVVIAFVSLVVFTVYFIPVESDYYSPKPFCEMMKKTVGYDGMVRGYKSWDNTIRYYYGRHVDVMEKEEQLTEYLNSPTKVYCFMWQKVYKKLPENIKNRISVVDDKHKVLEKKMVLVSN